MNRLTGFLLIFVLSILLISCMPIGAISGDDWETNQPKNDLNEFWTVPKRNVYNLGDYFNRNSDLLAFALRSGNVIPVSVDEITISIISNPNSSDPDEPIPVSGNTYRLVAGNVGSGRKLIVVTYEDQTTEYSIEVMDPHGLDPGGGNGGGGGNDGSGIGIIWG